MSTTRALVIVPTYEEADNVIPLSRQVLAASPGLEMLVVDDASPDGTGDRVATEARSEPRLHLLRRPGKLGLGSAYQSGFRYALEGGYDLALTMDCDFSHHPRYLPGMLAAAERADLVVGSRYVKGGGVSNWSPRRRLLSSFANFYTRMLLRVPTRDCTAGFRCYHRHVLERVDVFSIQASGYSFLEEMIWRVHHAGFVIYEFPIVFESRHHGRSKIDPREIHRAAFHVLRTAFRRPPSAKRSA